MAVPRRRVEKAVAVRGAHVLVVESRYYADIADALWAGAERALDRAGVTYERLAVPGALEIPQAIAIAAKGRRFDGAIALGCVIRGETSHYDIVAGESARALMDYAIAYRFPIGNGVLTVDTEAQAKARADGSKLDKGGDAVAAALSLIALRRARKKVR